MGGIVVGIERQSTGQWGEQLVVGLEEFAAVSRDLSRTPDEILAARQKLGKLERQFLLNRIVVTALEPGTQPIEEMVYDSKAGLYQPGRKIDAEKGIYQGVIDDSGKFRVEHPHIRKRPKLYFVVSAIDPKTQKRLVSIEFL